MWVNINGSGRGAWVTNDTATIDKFKKYATMRIANKRNRKTLSERVKPHVIKEPIHTQPSAPITAVGCREELSRIIQNLRDLGYEVECRVTAPSVEL